MRVVRSEQMASDGLIYSVRICGRLTADARWEGWIEFEPHDGARALRTPRETTQSSLVNLMHWADTLTNVYLDGALSRAIDAAAPRIAAA